jgi:hypothetical protein
MNKNMTSRLLSGALVTLLGAGPASADTPPARGQGNMPNTVTAGELMSTSAKVERVNLEKRELVLRNDEGNKLQIQVPENVTRLDQVKPGDRVNLDYYQAVAVSLKKPGSAPMGTETQTFGKRTPGELPGGMTGRKISTTAKITKIDQSKDQFTIETPDGEMSTIKAKDPQNRAELKKLKTGDEIQVTYTEAVAASVTPK